MANYIKAIPILYITSNVAQFFMIEKVSMSISVIKISFKKQTIQAISVIRLSCKGSYSLIHLTTGCQVLCVE